MSRLAGLAHSRPRRGGAVERRAGRGGGPQSAVEWRDSGRPIPEADEARRLAAELEKKITDRKPGA